MSQDTSLLLTTEYSRLPKYALAAIGSWFGSLAIGSVIGYSSPALKSLDFPDSEISMTKSEESWFGSLITLGASLGAIIAGYCVGKFGRKLTLIFSAVPFIVGWFFISYATNVVCLLIGRFLCGIGMGAVSLAAPIYIAETSSPAKRGLLGSGFQLSITLGILLSFVIGVYVPWSWLATINTFYPIAFLVLMVLLPETPIWLMRNHKVREATNAMLFLYGSNPTMIADPNLTAVEDETVSWGDFKKREIRLPLTICLSVMLFQQASGVNAILFFSSKIFDDAGSKMDSNVSTIIVGAVQVVFTLVSMLIIDRAGRKLLLVLSGIFCCISLCMLSIYFYFVKNLGQPFQEEYGWIALMAMAIFIVFFSLGYGGIPWLLMSELLPHKVKGVASAMAASFNWFIAFLVSKEYYDMNFLLGLDGTYLVFAIIVFIGVIFVIWKLPETKGRTLQEIENIFRRVTV